MLKIKFNINKFTIIFLRRFEGKNECKRISFSLYQLQRPLLLFFSVFSASAPLFFSFSFFQFRRPLLLFSFFFSSWLFSFSTSLFVLFLAQNLLQPKKPTQSLQFVRASLSRWSQTACLKTKRDPLFMPILKPKKKKNLPSASIHPKPNILSSYFVSFIWINLHFL